MKVIVNMACGLANRMFQYSYYLYLKKLGYDACVDYYTTAKLEHEHVAWNDVFPHAQLRLASAFDVLRTGGGSDILSRIRRRYMPFSCNVKVLSAFDAPIPDEADGTVYMMGVFQNAAVVEAVRQEVLDAFDFHSFTDEYNMSLAREMQSTESVAIHVRKGADYVSRVFYKDTCPAEYYSRAVELIRQKVKNPRFYVFADNKEWVRDNLGGLDYTLVDGNPVVGFGSHFDMQLMSCCKHNIISNSTYSWWGAFLNKNRDKTVVLPDEWFNPQSCEDYRSKSVLCDGWIAI